ncbi:MAG: bifunctional UDP-sugar hydrolase/5'-nucleotidase [Vicinamibacterales bacterium]
MTRRLFIIAALLALLAPAHAPAQPASARLTILHTNDTHGHLLPFSYPTVAPAGSDIDQLTERRDIGGIARRAALAQQIRTEQKGRGIPVWLVDVGDYSDGTPFSTEYKGEADVAAMNAAGYDFSTIGNHEFNYPLAQLQKLLRLTRHPVLLANAVDRATKQPIGQAWRVEKLGSLRVGLFGLVTRDSASYPAAREGVDILDEISTAKRIVEALRKEADIVILLSHAGEGTDVKLAAEVPGIDVIVGGHSHSRLPIGQLVWRGDDLKQNDVNGTVIVQAFQWGGELGRLDLLFEKDAAGVWRVSRYRARLVPITPDLPAEPMVAAVVDKYWKPIAARFGEVVGRASADFSSRGDDAAPYNLVADAVRETYKVDVGFENSGGVRAPLVAGDVTRADIVAMDPFGNTVVLFKATGAHIKALLARHAPYVAGLRYRLVDGTLEEATIGGAPIEDGRTYTAATNSYFAGFALKEVVQEDTGRLRADVVINYLREKGTVTPAYDGRRVVIGRRNRSGA